MYAWDRDHQPVYVIECEADLGSGLFAAGLLTGFAGKDAYGVGAPLREDGFNCVCKACAVRQQEYYCGNAPCHACDGDERAAAVEEHCLPRLT